MDVASNTSTTASDGDRKPRFSDEALGRLILCATIAVVYPRMYFSYAFFDEAYYLAIPYSFTLGVRPFFDEPSIYQLAAFFTQPFIELYVAITGSSAGLVLFGRHLYFASSILCVLALRHFWKPLIGSGPASALTAVVVAYVPFCIFGLSYNTMTYFGLLAGLSFLGSACMPGQRARDLSIATLILTIVSFIYPPIFLASGPALAVGATWIFKTCERDEGTRALLRALMTGGASTAIAVAGLMWMGFPDAFDGMVEFSTAQGAQGGGAMKWKSLQYETAYQAWFLVLIALSITGISLILSQPKHFAVSAFAALSIGPALAFATTYYRLAREPFTTVPFVLSILGLSAPVALSLARKHLTKDQRVALALYAGTSIAAGLCIIWSTANGLRNGALGLTPAALVTIGCLFITLRGQTATGAGTSATASFQRHARIPAMLFVFSLLCFQLHQIWTHAYRDYIPSQTNSWTKTGPWAGIRTNVHKTRFLELLAHDLEVVRENAQTILFFDYFPAGYLLTNLTPRAPGLWLFPFGRKWQGTIALRNVYEKRLRDHDTQPDIVVRVRCLPTSPFMTLPIAPRDPVNLLLGPEQYETAIDRDCYHISRRRNSKQQAQHRNTASKRG